MKHLPLFLLLLLCAQARADLTIVQKVEGAEGLHKITMKVKGEKARVEVTPEVTTIVDGKTGDVLNILHGKKIVMRLPGDKAKAAAEMARTFVQENAPGQSPPKPTGKKETIDGYETTEYVTDSPKFHASYWVATDYPDYKKILDQMSVLKKGAFASVTRGMPDYNALPGLPLRTVVRIQGQPEITSTIESVSLAPLPDSDFVAPSGYTEMALPDINLQIPGQSPKPGNP
jgi:hypothetical protein